MAIINFNSEVLSAFGQTPSNLGWSLSSGFSLSSNPAGNLIEYVPTVVLESVNNTVRGIAFNALTSPASGTGIFTTISAAPGTSVKVDRAYNVTTMEVINTDYKSSLFTVVTAGTGMMSLTSNGYDTSYPEISRLFTLGYI